MLLSVDPHSHHTHARSIPVPVRQITAANTTDCLISIAGQSLLNLDLLPSNILPGPAGAWTEGQAQHQETWFARPVLCVAFLLWNPIFSSVK